MLRNYLTIAYRNLLKNKVFSLINILGLAIGMAACLLILQYVRFELSYDDFHKETENAYRVAYQSYKGSVLESQNARTYPALGAVLQADFPEVADFTRLVILGEAVITYEQASVRETQIYLTDTSFFHLFSFPILRGNAQTALAQPFTVLISRSMADKIFGQTDPMNQVIALHSNNLDGAASFTVKGVFEDIPANAHLKPQILLSYPTLHEFIGKDIDQSWGWNNLYTYVLLHPNTNITALNDKLSGIAMKYNEKFLREIDTRWQFFLQPLQAIHLHSDLLHEIEANGSAKSIYFLSAVAVFILIIALVNFINLSTARAVQRAKEVGIRKVAGALRAQLIWQFITESLVLNLIGILLAVTLVQVSAAAFNKLSGIPSAFSIGTNAVSLLLLLGLLLFSALASSLYPAFVLSHFKPISVLKGNFSRQRQGIVFRKGLVVFQFVVSIVLIAGTLAAHRQLFFMRNQDLGMNVRQVMVIQAPKATDATQSNWGTFKSKLDKLPGIVQATAANEVPGKEIYWQNDNISLPNEKPTATFTGALVETHFFDLLQIKTIAGRVFDPALDERSQQVVINETASQVLGFQNPEQAVLQKLQIGDRTADIVGVVADFHQQSLKNALQPMLFHYASDDYGYNYYLVKTNQANVGDLVSKVKSTFAEVFPNNPFDYFFLDDFFNAQYKADQQFSKVFSLFSGLAILVASLGLFGLVSYATTQRTKEIGIRKVLGASVSRILFLLNKDLIKLMLLANLIAWPLAYWGIRAWLQHYAFRIDISIWLLLAPTCFILLIALLTISFQTIRAALANPVDSLRYE